MRFRNQLTQAHKIWNLKEIKKSKWSINRSWLLKMRDCFSVTSLWIPMLYSRKATMLRWMHRTLISRSTVRVSNLIRLLISNRYLQAIKFSLLAEKTSLMVTILVKNLMIPLKLMSIIKLWEIQCLSRVNRRAVTIKSMSWNVRTTKKPPKRPTKLSLCNFNK